MNLITEKKYSNIKHNSVSRFYIFSAAAMMFFFLFADIDSVSAKNFTIFNALNVNQPYFSVNGTTGNVGIGTTTPLSQLHLYKGASGATPYANSQLIIENNGRNIISLLAPNTEDNYIMFGSPAASNRAFIGYTNSANANPDAFVFKTAGNFQFNGGNVGIGTTNPGTTLDIGGAIASFRAKSATLSNIGSGVIMADASGNLYSTSTAAATGIPSPTGINGQTLRSNGTSWIANNLLFNDGTNVGIGTTAPAQKLDVQGNIALATNILGGGKLYGYAAGASTATLQLYNATTGNTILNNVSYSIDLQTATTSRMYINNIGNVGIGTTAPTRSLDIASNVVENASGSASQLTVRGTANSTNKLNIGYDTTSNFGFIEAVNEGSSWQNLSLQPRAGSVGIGTASPGATLDIRGATASLRANSATLSNIGSGVIMADASGNLYSTSTAAATGIPSPSGLSGQTLRSNGTNWIANNLLFNDGTNVGIGTTTLTAKLGIQGSGSDILNLFDSVGAEKVSVLNNGNVGIGTTSPANNLHIIHANNTSGGIRISDIAGNAVMITGSKGSNGLPYIGSYSNNAFTLGANQTEFMRISSTGFVGIGITSPTNKLHIAQSDSALANSALLISDTQSGENNRLYIGSNTDGAYYRTDYTTGGDLSHRFFTYNTEVMRISGNGNVGIGTTNPGTTLDIGGAIASFRAKSATLSNIGSGVIMADASGNLYSTSTAAATGIPSPSGLSGQTLRSNGTNWIANNLLYNNGTNVGIGITAPKTILNINGGTGSYPILGTNVASSLFVARSDNLVGTYFGYAGDGNGWIQQMRNDGATAYNLILQPAGGNVGIGTTNPLQKLVVTNNLAITNTSGAQYLLMGNQDSAGVNKPSVITAANGSLSFGYGNSWSGSGGTITNNLVLTSTGNIGIGTISPTSRLQIASGGGISFAGNFKTYENAYSVSTATSSALIDDTGAAFNVGKSYRVKAVVPGTGTETGAVAVFRGNGTTFTLLKNFDAGLSSNNIEFFLNGGVPSVRLYSHPNLYAITVLTEEVLNKGWAFGPEVNMYGNPSGLVAMPYGNVAIGTTTAGTTLDIGGAIASFRAKSATLSNIGSGVIMADASGNLYSTSTAAATGIPSPSGLSGQTLRSNGTSWIANNLLYNNGTNVGIGTTNPANASLQVARDISAIVGVGQAQLIVNGATDSSKQLMVGFNTTSNYGFIQTLHQGVNWSDYNLILQPAAGNVGIGTTTPGTKLYVNGAATINGIAYVTTGLELSTAGSQFVSYYGPQANGYFEAMEQTGVSGYGTYGPVTSDWAMYNRFSGANTRGWIWQLGTTNIAALSGAGHLQIAGNLNSQGTGSNYFAGNIGIGTTNPGTTLDVSGTGSLRSKSATISNIGAGIVMANASGDLYSSTSPTFAGGTMNGDLNMNGFNILNVNKLNVNTIDPLYNIRGAKYSTYASSISGGVKEEYVGKITVNSLGANKEYEKVIDFADEPEGTDLWVWRQVIDFNSDNVEVLITPYGRFANAYYLIKNNKLIFRSDKPVTLSYRLIGRRFDWRQWPTRATDQTQTGGLEIK